VYNATTGSSVIPLVSGVISPDVIGISPIQTFDNKNVGTGKILMPSGLVINDGNSGNNYSINYVANGTGVITKLDTYITGSTSITKVYDQLLTAPLGGSLTVAPLLLSDIVIVSGSPVATFADKNVGTGKPITITGATITGADAANYNLVLTGLTGSITQASLTVTGLTASNKVYNANTNATVIGTPAVTPLAGDVVTISGTPIGTFADKNVGTAKQVLITGLALGGADAGNYSSTLIGVTADITKAPATATAQSDSRTYNATTNSFVSPLVSGIISPDVIGTWPVQVFNTKDVGTGKTLTPSGLVINDGNGGNNYSIVYSSVSTGVITTANLGIYVCNKNKTYGTTLTGGPGFTCFTPSGLQGGETVGTVTIAYGNGSAATAALGTYTGSVVASAATGGTFSPSNYSITYNPPGNIIVDPAPLTITGHRINKLVGTILSGGSGSLAFNTNGLVNGETINSVTITYGSGSLSTDPAGTYLNSVIPSSPVGGGTFVAGNYTITYQGGNLYVYPKAAIITQPADIDSCESATAIFQVTANTGLAWQKYYWQFRENSTSAFKDLINPPIAKFRNDKTSALSVDSIKKTYAGYQFNCKIVTKFWEDSLATPRILRSDSITTRNAVLKISDPPKLYAIYKKGTNILICPNMDTVTYQWGFNNSLLSNQTRQYFVSASSISATDLPKYFVITKNSKKCTSKVTYGQTFPATIPWVAENTNAPFGVIVSPNPSNGTFTIAITGIQANVAMRVYIRDYTSVTYYANANKISTTTSLNLRTTTDFPVLKTGIYFIDIIQGNNRVVKKILVNAN
jgi:hypothetical protein